MAVQMPAAYYSRGCDSRELFAGLQVEHDPGFESHQNRYDVILLNMQFLTDAGSRGQTWYLEDEVLEEILEEYGDLVKNPDRGLARGLRKIYAKTGKKFIFLIDEWDCVMRQRQESEAFQKQYLDFLQNLLKDQPYAVLVYMTGILPVKKCGQGAGQGPYRGSLDSHL